MARFSIIHMEKEAINFPKLCTMRDHAVKSELSRIMIQINMENDSKILKFEALYTETCKLNLEAMLVLLFCSQVSEFGVLSCCEVFCDYKCSTLTEL